MSVVAETCCKIVLQLQSAVGPNAAVVVSWLVLTGFTLVLSSSKAVHDVLRMTLLPHVWARPLFESGVSHVLQE